MSIPGGRRSASHLNPSWRVAITAQGWGGGESQKTPVARPRTTDEGVTSTNPATILARFIRRAASISAIACRFRASTPTTLGISYKIPLRLVSGSSSIFRTIAASRDAKSSSSSDLGAKMTHGHPLTP